MRCYRLPGWRSGCIPPVFLRQRIGFGSDGSDAEENFNRLTAAALRMRQIADFFHLGVDFFRPVAADKDRFRMPGGELQAARRGACLKQHRRPHRR